MWRQHDSGLTETRGGKKKNLRVVRSLSLSYRKCPSSVARLEAGHCPSTWMGQEECACHLLRPNLNHIKRLVFKNPQLQVSASCFRRGALWCQGAYDVNLIEMKWTTQKNRAPGGISLLKLWRRESWVVSTLHHPVEEFYLILLVQDQALSL